MKKILLIAMSASQILFSNADAKKRIEEITVTAPPTVPVWAAKLSRKLDDTMRYPAAILGTDPVHGFVRIRFSMNADGSLSGMQVTRRSGSRLLDNAALSAVAKLDRISVMPIGITAGRFIEAHLLFAQTEGQMRELVAANKAYRESPSERIASANDRPLLLASLARMPDKPVD